eukprot:Opistho-1_new@30927
MGPLAVAGTSISRAFDLSHPAPRRKKPVTYMPSGAASRTVSRDVMSNWSSTFSCDHPGRARTASCLMTVSSACGLKNPPIHSTDGRSRCDTRWPRCSPRCAMSCSHGASGVFSPSHERSVHSLGVTPRMSASITAMVETVGTVWPLMTDLMRFAVALISFRRRCRQSISRARKRFMGVGPPCFFVRSWRASRDTSFGSLCRMSLTTSPRIVWRERPFMAPSSDAHSVTRCSRMYVACCMRNDISADACSPYTSGTSTTGSWSTDWCRPTGVTSLDSATEGSLYSGANSKPLVHTCGPIHRSVSTFIRRWSYVSVMCPP